MVWVTSDQMVQWHGWDSEFPSPSLCPPTPTHNQIISESSLYCRLRDLGSDRSLPSAWIWEPAKRNQRECDLGSVSPLTRPFVRSKLHLYVVSLRATPTAFYQLHTGGECIFMHAAQSTFSSASSTMYVYSIVLRSACDSHWLSGIWWCILFPLLRICHSCGFGRFDVPTSSKSLVLYLFIVLSKFPSLNWFSSFLCPLAAPQNCRIMSSSSYNRNPKGKNQFLSQIPWFESFSCSFSLPQ